MPTTAIQQQLARLRGQLRRWVLVRGLARWLWVVLAVLALDMFVDRAFKMDFAQRLVMLVLMAGGLGAYLVWRVLRPLAARATDDSLVYEVEAKHPELQEALLSGWQLSREGNLAALGMSGQLAQATIDEGIRRAGQIQFGNALDLARHRKHSAMLVAGLVLVLGLGWTVNQDGFFKTWFNRNVLLLDDAWPQATYLEIAGVVDGKLVVPRGTDHRQLVTVSQDSSVTDVTVSLEVENPGGRSLLPMKPTGRLDGREHTFTFHNVSSRFRFRASGGDDITEWVEVELVEPPSVSELELTALLPEYTGVAEEPLVGAGPHAVLRGSRLRLAITANKPLAAAELQLGEDRFPLTRGDSDVQFSLALPESGELAGGEYEILLQDQAGRENVRRTKFKITIKEDRPPQVRASLLGISGLVVPRANLPTSYQAADEYRLMQLAFDCDWKGPQAEENSEPTRRQIVFAAADTPGPLQPPIDQVRDVAVLDLEPLQLEPGTSFRFSVTAQDNDPHGPNAGNSQEFLLRVVTEEELRADLLRREIEQRKAFDQAYQNQLALNTELQAILVRQPGEGTSQDEFLSQRELDLIETVRVQKSVGTSIDRVATRFEEFLVEIKNNRLDEAENEIAPDQRIEERFDARIIQPIRKLDQELIALAARHLDACRSQARDPAALQQAASVAASVQEQILLEMKQILAAMSDSENFQGIINDILEVKRDTEAIKQGIGNPTKPGDGIFDDDIFDK